MPPPDLGDYTSSLSYGHMPMVNDHLVFFFCRTLFLLFICRVIQVVCHLHYHHYVLEYIIHLKIHHVLVRQQLMENLMNRLKIFPLYECCVYVFNKKFFFRE
jgi:hypothetical protein